MTTLASSSPTREETPLQQEQRIFGELFSRLIDSLLNKLFDLRPRAAAIRMYLLIFLFFVCGVLVSLVNYPLNIWVWHVQDILGYLFDPAYVQHFPGNPFYNLINYAYAAFTDPRTLQYLPIFLAPFFIALHTAANYLADIFELEEPSIARKFLWSVSLTGSNEVIRISRGDVYESHKQRPIHLIGGPGRVMVDIDSAALFEKPDGTPRVIGPTGREPGGKAQLDGFERFRQAIDLRDHLIELRDDDGRSAVITGRSLDGIPVTATDVCFVFSVHRAGQKPTMDHPYPFNEKAIEQLIYRAASRVTPTQANPSSFEFSWINNMVGLIRSRLGNFMNNHKLTEYLASIGQPEEDRVRRREAEITEARKELGPAEEERSSSEINLPPLPEFKPRYKILKDLFNQFTEEFAKVAAGRGVELQWIGVGTWKTPIEIVPAKHWEAWMISRENLEKESEFARKLWVKEATVQKFMSLIQEVPLTRYQTVAAKYDHPDALEALLDGYRDQLVEVAEFKKAKGEPVPSVITRAIDHLNQALGKDDGWSWQTPPGESPPPSDEPSGPKQGSSWQRSEEALYNELLVLLFGDESVADRLIDEQSKLFPQETRRQWIERARDRLLRDRK